ncbi:hypothetical protein D3C80_1420460 [compost metagenome]
MDYSQFSRAGRYGTDLSGAGEGEWQGGGAELGGVPRHADRAGGAGRRLFYDPCRCTAALHTAYSEAGNGHCVSRRLDYGGMVPGPSQGELLVYPF